MLYTSSSRESETNEGASANDVLRREMTSSTKVGSLAEWSNWISTPDVRAVRSFPSYRERSSSVIGSIILSLSARGKNPDPRKTGAYSAGLNGSPENGGLLSSRQRRNRSQIVPSIGARTTETPPLLRGG